MSILIHNARILTLKEGAIPRRGPEANDLSVIPHGYVLIGALDVLQVRAGDAPPSLMRGDFERPKDDDPNEEHFVINAHGRVVMPAFVDAHTHACWAGNRLDEWDMKRAGVSYLDILNAGGGIMSTVRAVRNASEDELAHALEFRLRRMAWAGSTTVEVKTGYGLTPDAELKMMRAIRIGSEAARFIPFPTLLLGHALDPEMPHQVETIIDALPEFIEALFKHREATQTSGVLENYFCIDAYCEVGAWSVENCSRLFEASKSPFRVHADQFNSLGMTPLAVEMGALSVDHLEASTNHDLKTLAESKTFGVMLPACGFHLDDRYANGRKFVDMGGALVIASNYNPGSAPCYSMPFIISLAVRKLGLTIEEAISACTVNARALLGHERLNDWDYDDPEYDSPFLSDLGQIVESNTIAPTNQLVNIIMLRHTDERMLAFEFAGDPVELVIANSRLIKWIGDDSDRTIIKP